MSTYEFTDQGFSDELANCVKVSISSVFHKTFGYMTTFEDDEEEKQKIGEGIVGIISFIGDISWIMMLGLPKETGMSLITKFTGFELDYDSPDMGDVVGELSNVLSGDIVARLKDGSVKVQMSLPTIIRGHDVEPLLPRGMPSKKFIFHVPEGMVMIKIVGSKSGEMFGRKPGT